MNRLQLGTTYSKPLLVCLSQKSWLQKTWNTKKCTSHNIHTVIWCLTAPVKIILKQVASRNIKLCRRFIIILFLLFLFYFLLQTSRSPSSYFNCVALYLIIIEKKIHSNESFASFSGITVNNNFGISRSSHNNYCNLVLDSPSLYYFEKSGQEKQLVND